MDELFVEGTCNVFGVDVCVVFESCVLSLILIIACILVSQILSFPLLCTLFSYIIEL